MKYIILPVINILDRVTVFIFGGVMWCISYVISILWNFKIPEIFYFIDHSDGPLWEFDEIYKTPYRYLIGKKNNRYNK